jgi:hypothetical protein
MQYINYEATMVEKITAYILKNYPQWKEIFSIEPSEYPSGHITTNMGNFTFSFDALLHGRKDETYLKNQISALFEVNVNEIGIPRFTCVELFFI